MGRKLLPLLFLLCSIRGFSQKLEIFSPPVSGGTQSNVQAYQDLFTTVLKQPTHVNGMAVIIQWGQIDNLGNTQTSPCTESTCNWTATDKQLLAYINGITIGATKYPGLSGYPGTKLNLIVSLVPEAGALGGDQNQLPAYVFNPTSYTSNSWCSGCAAQDVVTCPGEWPGDLGGPTCASTNGASPTLTACSDPEAGVWNQAGACHLTGLRGQACPGTNFDTSGGFPVLYEAPIMTAYQHFVDVVLQHYSSQGTGMGPQIGAYIGYIRVGLAQGGENLPTCTVATVNTITGVWPSPRGLSYDLSQNPPVYDWYATTTNCQNNADCQGKYAYLSGDPSGGNDDGTGYVKTMFASFQSNTNGLGHWNAFYNPTIQLMSNTHAGPPFNQDLNYADQEAPIFAGGPANDPIGSGYDGYSGFGMELLSEYDVYSYPIGRDCSDDWCNNFASYEGFPGGLNLYLQTETPNSAVTYLISNVVVNNTYKDGLVTCSQTCTDFTTPNAMPMSLYSGQGFALSIGNGPKTSYRIDKVVNATQFSCDPIAPCTASTQSQTLWTGDYLPDTIPFALSTYADTLEIYFCDWEFAFNQSSNPTYNGCQAYSSTYSPMYLGVLNAP